LALRNLRNAKSVLALHFGPGRSLYYWSSLKVGGIATGVARTACEALRGSAITDGDVFGKIEVIVEGECWRVAGVNLINGQRLPLSSVRVL
jgi:hypothetical protein